MPKTGTGILLQGVLFVARNGRQAGFAPVVDEEAKVVGVLGARAVDARGADAGHGDGIGVEGVEALSGFTADADARRRRGWIGVELTRARHHISLSPIMVREELAQSICLSVQDLQEGRYPDKE